MKIRSVIFWTFRKAAGCILVFYCISAHVLNAQNDFPIQPVFIYTADVAANVSGGISTGIGYLGYAVAGVEFDIGKAGWWKGGSLVLTGGCTHGCEPSAQWIGDFQMADNIEAGNHVFLQELYWHQSLGPVEVTAGMQDYCMHYTFLDAAGLYLNSSFGTNSVLSSNHALPIFPILGWGLNAQWQITDCLSWQAAIFDVPLDFEENPYNLRWEFNAEKGANAVTEWAFSPTICGKESCFKFSCCAQTAGAWSLHLCMEQCVWENGSCNLTPFVMFGKHFSDDCCNHFQYAVGGNWTGIFSKKGKDVLGLAVVSAHFKDGFLEFAHKESSVELTYRYALNEHFYLQPDVQYVLHPSAAEQTADNALFGAVRLGVEL